MPTNQPRRTPVLIPGIMGSNLWYEKNGDKQWIWPPDLRHLYKTLVNAPSRLSWHADAKLAQAQMTEKIYFAPFGDGGIGYRLWTRVLDVVEKHANNDAIVRAIRVGYDWRASLLLSAETLHGILSESMSTDVSRAPEPGDDRRFLIVAHSMGGLLFRAAVGSGRLHAGWVDRVIFLGTPFDGSPEAFRSLFEGPQIELLQTIYRYARPTNYRRFRTIIAKAFGTFPSLVQLMVPAPNKYIRFGVQSWANPLDQDLLPTRLIHESRLANNAFKLADGLMKEANTRISTIYTEAGCSTEIGYEVERIDLPGRVYRFLKTDRDLRGDGTVPAYSAARRLTRTEYEESFSFYGVKHRQLCNHRDIAACIASLFS